MYTYNAKILEVIDGDTMIIDIDLGFYIHHIHRLRVAKFDAPEIFHPKNENELNHGLKAKNKASELLLNKNVIITTKKSFTDKYGRYLCSITIGEIDFAAEMIKEGFQKRTDY